VRLVLSTPREGGQASVETVALLPLVALLAALAWQVTLAGQTVWLAGGAARAAARAHALGAAPLPAARASVPRELRAGLSARSDGEGVRVRLRVPAIVPGASVGSVTARAQLPPQGR
jgi:hypothetical protein